MKEVSQKPKPFVPEKPPVLGAKSSPDDKPRSFASTQPTPKPQPSEVVTRQLSDSASSEESTEPKPHRPTPPQGRGRGGRGSGIRGLGAGRGNSSNEIQRNVTRTVSIEANNVPPPVVQTPPPQSPDVSGNNSVNESEDSQEQESLDSASVEEREEKPQSSWARKVVPNTQKRKTLIDRTANTSSIDSEDELQEQESETLFITIFDHPPQNDGEINLLVGDIVTLVEKTTHEWFFVRLGEITGYVAAEYVELYVSEEEKPEATTSTENDLIETRPRKPTQPTTPAPSVAPNFHANRSASPGGSAVMPNRTVNLGPQKKSSKFATLRFPTKKKKEKEFTISRSDEFTIARADTAPNLQKSEQSDSPSTSAETPMVEVEQVDQRTKIVREILSTEQHYVKILKTMIEV